MIPKSTPDEVCRGCKRQSIHGKMSLEPSSVFGQGNFPWRECGWLSFALYSSDDHTFGGHVMDFVITGGIVEVGATDHWINRFQFKIVSTFAKFTVDEVKEYINKNKRLRSLNLYFWYQSVNFMVFDFSSSGVTRRVLACVGDKAGLSTSWFIEFLSFDLSTWTRFERRAWNRGRQPAASVFTSSDGSIDDDVGLSPWYLCTEPEFIFLAHFKGRSSFCRLLRPTKMIVFPSLARYFQVFLFMNFSRLRRLIKAGWLCTKNETKTRCA